MTNKSIITVGDILRSDSKFDPMELDTSEIRELSNSMPKDGNIDLNNAEVLATKYLRGADLCGELLAMAIAYSSKTKDEKQRAYNQAFLVKSSNIGSIKTDKMRVAYAELDSEYSEACEKYNKAAAFKIWIESKKDSFIKAHYLCRNILKRGYEHENASNWNGSPVKEEEDGW